MIKQAAPAAKPTDIPPRGWKEVLKETWKEAGKDNITLVAAGVAFYAFSALVPMLTAFVLTYGLVAEPSSVVSHTQMLTNAMPRESASIIGEQLKSMSETAGTKTGFALLIALLIALYGASKGAGSLMTGLNIAWGTKESRGFVKRTLIAIAMIAGAVVVMLLVILAMSAIHLVESLLPSFGGAMHFIIQALGFILAALAVMGLLATIYRYGPDRPNAKWRWITPGSIVATLVWLLATIGFGFYVANFGSYNATYGSLGAVIVFLTWLYLSAYIVLLGAEMNAVLEQEVAVAPAAHEGEPASKGAQQKQVAAKDETQKQQPPAATVQPPSPAALAAKLAGASLLGAVLGSGKKQGRSAA
jgi:membrane protein